MGGMVYIDKSNNKKVPKMMKNIKKKKLPAKKKPK